MLDQYYKWFNKNRVSIFEDFFTFLRFPSISTDPVYQTDLLACKDWLVSYLEKIGMDVEVWETSGHPSIFASHMKTGREIPTVLFYCHYDVQPAVPLHEWTSPPFEPEIRNGKVYARGAVDNKGQGFYTILGVQAFLEHATQHKVNIKILIEGEEEIGSLGVGAILEEKRASLASDYIFVVDLNMYDEQTPAITLGIRGITCINVTVGNAIVDLHSGVYGGVVENPARALAIAIGKMWDKGGRVAIPNFYDGMTIFNREKMEAFDWESNIKAQTQPFDVKAFHREANYSLLESNWIRPTLEINGMESGYTGEGNKTIIPSKAMVKLSCRLVEGQDPNKVCASIESFLIKNLPKSIKVVFERGASTRGVVTSPHSKAVEIVVEAYENVFQRPCRRILCGATIPIVSMLAKVCSAEIVMMGTALSIDRMHSPNECFGVDRFEKGFLSITQILEIFARGI